MAWWMAVVEGAKVAGKVAVSAIRSKREKALQKELAKYKEDDGIEVDTSTIIIIVILVAMLAFGGFWLWKQRN